MKKISVYLLVCICLAVSILSLSGCGIKEKAANAISEKMVEKALGDKVDINGDTLTIKGDNGEEATIGSGKWPDSELARKIPQFKKGTVISSMKTDDNVTISLEKVKAEDLKPYLEDIKKAYSKDSYESEADGVITYSGSGADNITVAVHYVSGDEALIITITNTAQ